MSATRFVLYWIGSKLLVMSTRGNVKVPFYCNLHSHRDYWDVDRPRVKPYQKMPASGFKPLVLPYFTPTIYRLSYLPSLCITYQPVIYIVCRPYCSIHTIFICKNRKKPSICFTFLFYKMCALLCNIMQLKVSRALNQKNRGR